MFFRTSLLYSLRMLFVFVVVVIIISFLGAPAVFFLLRWKYTVQKAKLRSNKTRVGIFHPYCNAAGGGEKVLWVALEAMKKRLVIRIISKKCSRVVNCGFFRYPHAELFVYTGDVEATPDEILKKVKGMMNVDLDGNCVKFIYLTKRRWLESNRYPYFTLLGQSLGSIYVGFEALNQLNPGIKIF